MSLPILVRGAASRATAATAPTQTALWEKKKDGRKGKGGLKGMGRLRRKVGGAEPETES